MNFYLLKTSLLSDQTSLIDSIKHEGGECIQSSDGLFIAIDHPITAIDGQAVLKVSANQADLSPDLQKFIAKYR